MRMRVMLSLGRLRGVQMKVEKGFKQVMS